MTALPAAALDEAALLLLAARRVEAVELLAEAQRCAPGDSRIAHVLLLACYHTLRDPEARGRLGDEEAEVMAERVIATWVLLAHREPFWSSWLVDRLRCYGEEWPEALAATLCDEVVAELRARIEELGASANAPPRFAPLLLRELAAARQLAAAGGLPPPAAGAGGLVCGPLLVQALGCVRAFGTFVAALAEDPVARLFRILRGEQLPPVLAREALDRLRRLFSRLGEAQALLDLERAEEAWEALAILDCPQCRRAGSPSPGATGRLPVVCAVSCPGFDQLNPGYAAWPNKAERLAQDAIELSIDVQLALAQAAIVAPESDPAAAVAHFREALRLAPAAGRQEAVERRIVETVVGRAKVLADGDGLSAAIALVEASRALLAERPPAPAPDAGEVAVSREELTGLLVQLLVGRGMAAVKDLRWEAAVADFRQATVLNPHAAAPVLGLSTALLGWARELRRSAPERAVELQLEAVQGLRARYADLADVPSAVEHVGRVRRAARDLILGRAEDLAASRGFEQALEVLEQGLAVLGGDNDSALARKRREVGTRYADFLERSGQPMRANEVRQRVR